MTDTPSQQIPHVSDPDSPTPTQSSPWRCEESLHIRPMTFLIYTTCRRFSAKSGVLYCSADTIAERFLRMSVKTVYKHLDILIEGGWLILTRPSTRKANGHNSARHFRVVRHDEWVENHRVTCKPPVRKSYRQPYPETTYGENHTPELPMAIGKSETGHRSERLHSLKEPSLKEPSLKEPSVRQPLVSSTYGQAQNQSAEARQSGGAQPYPILTYGVSNTPLAPVDDLVDRFGSRRKRKGKDTTLPTQPAPVAPVTPPSPVITPAAALARAVGKRLGFTSPLETGPWETTIQRIADTGNDLETVLGTFRHYIGTYGEDVVEREGATGFEVAFDRLQREWTAELIQTMNVPNGRKEQDDAA